MQFPLYLTARAWHVLSLSHNNKNAPHLPSPAGRIKASQIAQALWLVRSYVIADYYALIPAPLTSERRAR